MTLASIDGSSALALHVMVGRRTSPRVLPSLTDAAHSLADLAYANKLRSEVVTPVIGDSHTVEPLKRIINTTGHTASACGPGLVAVIGGWRPTCDLPHLHVFVIDVRGRALRVPELVEGSVRPSRRSTSMPTLMPQQPLVCLS